MFAGGSEARWSLSQSPEGERAGVRSARSKTPPCGTGQEGVKVALEAAGSRWVWAAGAERKRQNLSCSTGRWGEGLDPYPPPGGQGQLGRLSSCCQAS